MPEKSSPLTETPFALSRRDLARFAGTLAAAAATGTTAAPLPAQALPESNTPALAPLNRFPRMVHEYFVEQVRAAERRNLAAKAALKTKADAEAYVREVQRKVRESFGPLPEKTPLNPRIMKSVDRDAYRIENVIFESRPGFFVTANLYIPKGREFPLPGVVGTCGHSANGKAGETYQAFSQGLARLGYVVLIYDPIGQGERMQYVDDAFQPRKGTGTREHLHAGNQQFLVGDFFGTWRAWDGIRALDYLFTRSEVDPKQVGVTGNSGGGTMTTWLCGLEQRWTMAAPSCFVTTFRRNMENELPADTEQCPPKALALGLDHDDFIAAMAPKPVKLLGKEKDYFDARGHEEAYQRLNRLYKLLDAEANIARFRGPTYHGYSRENREAMYQWFNRVTGVSDVRSEPTLTFEKDETLWCTPHGQVAELHSRTVFSFTKAKSEALAGQRGRPSGTKLIAAVRETLRIPERTGIPDFRILRPLRSRSYPAQHAVNYVVETEPGIQSIVYRLSEEPLMSRPPLGQTRAVLYVSHHSADDELRNEPLVRELYSSEKDAAFFAVDPRGIGDSRPDTCNADSFLNPYGSDYFYAIHSLMLDYPYLGQKTFDLLRVLDWFGDLGHTEVHLVAKGWGTIPATFAALLAPSVTQVTLKYALASYTAIAESEDYDWPLSSFVPGVLEKFDLPDCYRQLESKKLRMIEPSQAVSKS
jgi:dienelactone hydrolase